MVLNKKKIKWIEEYGILVMTIFIFICTMLRYILTQYFDNDVYFMLAEGKEIFRNGIQYENTFFIHEGYKKVVQQWMWDVIVYFIYGHTGKAGLFFFTVSNVVLFSIALLHITRLFNLEKYISSILIVFTLLWSSGYFSIRPVLFSMTLLLLQIGVVEKYKRDMDWKILLWLILISLIEINMHCSNWIFHFVFLLPYYFPAVNKKCIRMNRHTYPVSPLIFIQVPMFLAGFLNPYGVDAMLYLLRSYNSKLKSLEIQELEVPTVMSMIGGLLIFAIIIFLYLYTKEIFDAEYIYMCLGCLLLGMTHNKNILFPCIAIFLLVANYCREKEIPLINENLWRFTWNRNNICNLYAPLLFTAIVSIFLIFTSYSTEETDNSQNVNYAVEYLQEHHIPEGTAICTNINCGNRLEYLGYKIYMDARPELYFESINQKEDVINENYDLMFKLDKETYSNFKEKYDFEYYITLIGTQIDCFLQTDPDFEQVVDSTSYRMFKKVK